MKSFVFITFLILFTYLNATIINVPADQTTIQAGITAATNTDTVLVQPGTYVENINYNGKLITVGSLYITTQDTTYISSTIIDGDSVGTVVTFDSGEDSTTVLCGFTITDGLGGGFLPNCSGGGITCTNSSSPSLENLKITGNTSIFGGGICCVSSSPNLINVSISLNSSLLAGGGLFCSYSSPSLENVSIIENYSNEGGGVLFNNSSSNLFYVKVSSNSANKGGGIYITDSDPNLKNVVISDNNASIYGGGIYSQNLSEPILQNVTVTGNLAPAGSGIYSNESGFIIIKNSIFWNNSTEEISGTAIFITYSDILGGWSGTGNIDSDPLFVSPSIGDYHLQPTSPCIDTGDPTSPLDPDGSLADMGSCYFDHYLIWADFTVDTTEGYAPLTVNFTDLSIPSYGGPFDEWYWDLGDGNFSLLQNPSNEYISPGIYTISLTVTDDIDSTSTETKINYITVFGNDPPAPPTDVQVEIVYPDAEISWVAVDTTLSGDPCITDGYIVLYNETAYEDEQYYYFLDYTTELNYTHTFVAQHREQMFYKVVSYVDISREEKQYLERLNNSHHKIRWSDVKDRLMKRSSLKSW